MMKLRALMAKLWSAVASEARHRHESVAHVESGVAHRFPPHSIGGVLVLYFLFCSGSVGTFASAADKRAGSETGAPSFDPWAVEDPKQREKLPLYKTIPAAKPTELTPHNSLPKREVFESWTRSHGSDGCERFSALTQINRSNVKQLEVAWTYHSGDGKGNIQCNPIIVNGVMFAPTVGDSLVALDATTGKELWRFKPEGRPAFRGLTWWPGDSGAGERIYFPTEKNWLYAIEPKTGKPVASFGEAGRVKLAQGARVAPVIFERTLVIAGYLKDVEAFDAVTGEPRWAFHTVPHGGEFGRETWEHTQENAANCWGGMALDTARGIAYITTGSPKPNFLGMLHRGDNLFANCVVALDARTGRRLWHFQELRHDIWDLDIPAPPMLTTITRDGKKVDVVAAVSKIGNTLLLDRVTGQPVFPFRLRRAPVSTVPGEVTAPYQPDVELPQPFARQEFKLADASERTPEVREWVLDRLKSAQFGWFLPMSDRKVTVFYNVHGGAEWTGACSDPTTGRLYVTANEVPWYMSLIANDEPREDLKAPPTAGRKTYELACLQCHGADRNGVGVAPPLRGLRHRLKDADVLALLKTGRGLMPVAPPMSDADQTALLDYLYLRDRPQPVKLEKPERPQFIQSGWNRFLDEQGYPAGKPPWGTLNCLDLNTGKLLWKVPLGEYAELTKQGVPKTGTENFGGAMVTAGGLVFAGGTRDEKIRAFDAETGTELWSAKLPWGGYAPPATYQVNGRQFIVIPATGGGKLGGPTGDAYVAFALPMK
jgi:quinoprotein glucose dehydrogenase